MTKADLINQVHLKTGYSKKDATEIVEDVLRLIKAALEQGHSVKISGFGLFFIQNKASRLGRNPHTGEPVEITPRKILSFKASAVLKSVMNNSMP